jgi:adenylate kinase
MTEKKQSIVLTGAPGSGKSTVLERLQDGFSARAVETGRLLRKAAEEETKLGREVRPYLEKGELAPTELVNRVVEQAVRHAGGSLLLFDGYPRNREEVRNLREMEEAGLFEPAVIIVLHLSRETALKRITGRRKCPDCGSTYNVHFDPPQQPDTCDRCGGVLEQREDDRPELVEKRLDVFEAETLPAIEDFQALRPERTINLSAEKSLNTVVEAAGRLLEKTGLNPDAHG